MPQKGKENLKENQPQEGQNPKNVKQTQTSPPESTARPPMTGQKGDQSWQPAVGSGARSPSEPTRSPSTPFTFMRRFSEEMDRLFEDFGFGTNRISQSVSGIGREIGRGLSGVWSPALEMFERGNKLIVRADLPGMRKEDVRIEIIDGSLSIAGERKQEHKEGNGGHYRTERSYGNFYRAIRLPEGVDIDNVNATFKDGVLEIEFEAPEPPRSRGRQVEIKS